jgi:hypothetical protein
MIQSQGKWIAEEDECWYGEDGEMVGKKMDLHPNPQEA